MAQPSKAPQTTAHDERLSCDYAQLVRLQAPAKQLALHNQLNKTSAMSGRHGSKFRGRGLNFEEIKHYQIGDDIRNIDWKVTLRSGKPHVRVYTEEKDRNVYLVVDQRSSLYFASTEVMKSVVAAETAALLGWHFLENGDRVGMVALTPDKLHLHNPKRGQKNYLAMLSQLAKFSQSLSVHSRDDAQSSFTGLVKKLNQLKLRNSTLIIVSDWHDCSAEDLQSVKQLQKHNEVLTVQVSDPLESKMSVDVVSQWVVGDGEYQLQLDSRNKVEKASQELADIDAQKRFNLSRLMAVQKLPFVGLDTQGTHLNQLVRALGGQL